MIDPQMIRAFLTHAMLTHPNHAKQIAAHAAADPEGTAELAEEYAAAVDDDDDTGGVDEPSDIDGADEPSEIDEQPEPAKPAPTPVVKSVAAPVPGGRKGRR